MVVGTDPVSECILYQQQPLSLGWRWCTPGDQVIDIYNVDVGVDIDVDVDDGVHSLHVDDFAGHLLVVMCEQYSTLIVGQYIVIPDQVSL